MSVTAKTLARMNNGELVGYIRDRLRGVGLDPPFFPDRGVEPENFLIESYQAEPALHKAFDQAVVSLLKEFVPAHIKKKDGDYFSRLLFLVERLEIKKAAGVIGKLWSKREEFKSVPSFYTEPDLFVQLAAATVLLIENEKLIEDLKPLLEVKPYAPVAYTAFIRMGLDRAMEFLPAFLRVAAGDDALVRRALRVMAEQYGEGDDYRGAVEFYEAFKNKCSFEDGGLRGRIEALMRDVREYRTAIELHEKKNNRQIQKARPPKSPIWKPVIEKKEKRAA